jgi:CubicO group peptidase (beta-lactamase class C family)
VPGTRWKVALFLLVASLSLPRISYLVPPLEAQGFTTRADSILQRFVGADDPGCAVAIDRAGMPAYRGAFGFAELEHRIPITVNTIFEAGSVSKQFTAAAVLLLEARGKLSLDDAVQKWFPEIPQYEWPLTVRHLMLHTSGMRDWGSVIGLSGWPRWTASYTHADALAIIARQRALNYQPGTAYGYTNTGYNLMAMLVERAGGESLASFTKREFFDPLGMTSTSWRDDFSRLVPGRAQAYDRRNNAWHLDMPFEHVHGNGGLLTTVGDLMLWTAVIVNGRVGNPDVSTAMRTSGRFNDGRAVNYGGGLSVSPIRGVPSFNHSGSTAGYRAMLAHFPGHQVTSAVLCNRGDADAPGLNIAILTGALPFTALPPRTAETMAPPYQVDPARLPEFVGDYHSDEVAGSLRVFVRENALHVERRPGQIDRLQAVGADHFTAPGGMNLRFDRDMQGKVTRLLVSVARVNAMPYERQ